jgi:hypothetical protein
LPNNSNNKENDMSDVKELPAVERLCADLAEIEEKVVLNWTLADAIREGCSVTDKKTGGWIQGGEACALGAAWIAAKARDRV